MLVAKLSMGALAHGRRVVRRLDEKSLEVRPTGGQSRRPRQQFERLVRRTRVGNLGRPGRLRRSAPKRAVPSSRPRARAAWSACVRPTGASAATVRWRSAGRWTRSDRSAGASRTARWCSTRCTVLTAGTRRWLTRRSTGTRRCRSSKLKIAYVKREFEPQAPRTPAAASSSNPNLTEEQRKQMEAQREAQRAQAEAQRTILADALEVFRKLGVRLQPIDLPDFPAQALRFILNAEACRRLRRSDQEQGDRSIDGAGAWRLAEHVPHQPVHSGRRVHPRPARAHAARCAGWTN